MKLLKIEKNLGYYLDEKGKFTPLDKITKDDILRLVNLTLSDDKVRFDEYSDKNLKNQAHQIIYKSIFEKLKGLKDRKQEFVDESERLYLTAYQKYRDNPTHKGS